MSTPVGRIGAVAYACAEPSEGGGDQEPSSEVRPVEGHAGRRRLRVFMCQLGPDAKGGWLTITDDAGTVHFEGELPADDSVEVELSADPSPQRVRLHLETQRGHRQADVLLNEALTEHVFV